MNLLHNYAKEFRILAKGYLTILLITPIKLQMVPVPIVDKNTKADSNMQLQITKPYIALNTETDINIRQQKLVT